MRPTWLSLVFACAATACGDDAASTVCGAGTMLEGGACVPTAPVECGAGTTLENGACVATPGPTCGPGTVLQGSECVVDTTAPGPVTGLTATVNGATVDLAWTAGASATGTLLVRLVAGAYDAPVPGTTYTAGQTLPGGATVVAVGSATAAADPLTTPGRVAYLAFSMDADGTYGFAREVAVRSLPAQTGAVTLDVAAATGTVTTQPANVGLAVSNVTYDAGGARLEFDLAVTNNTAGPLIQAKLAFGESSVGAVTGRDEALADGSPYLVLKAGAMLPGTTETRRVQVSSVGANDTVSVPLRLVESDMLATSAHLQDGDGGFSMTMRSPVLTGNGMDKAVLSYPRFSPSGRYLSGLSRWTGAYYRYDLGTGDVHAANAVSTAGSGVCQVMQPDGFVYAVFPTTPGHTRGDSFGLTAVKLDPISMTVVARSPSIDFGSRQSIYECASNDARLAVIVDASIYVLDLATLQFLDADATAAGVTPVVAPKELRHLVFSADGQTLYTTAKEANPEIYAVDMATLQLSLAHTRSNSDKVSALALGPDGSLYWGGRVGRTLYRLTGTTETSLTAGTGAVNAIRAIGPFEGTSAWVQGDQATALVDLTTGALSRISYFSEPDRIRHQIVRFDAVP